MTWELGCLFSITIACSLFGCSFCFFSIIMFWLKDWWMCSVKHLLVETKLELREALSTSQQSDADCVVEVSGSINSNAAFHRFVTSSFVYLIAFLLRQKFSDNFPFLLVSWENMLLKRHLMLSLPCPNFLHQDLLEMISFIRLPNWSTHCMGEFQTLDRVYLYGCMGLFTINLLSSWCISKPLLSQSQPNCSTNFSLCCWQYSIKFC